MRRTTMPSSKAGSTSGPTRRPGTTTSRAAIAVGALVLTLTGCSLLGESSDEPNAGSDTSESGNQTGQSDGTDGTDATEGTEPAVKDVVLLTHDSFNMPKKLIRAFESETGFDLTVRASGDAGAMTNKLVLTKDHPEGDVAFGVDNTFASRALDEGVFAPGEVELPAGSDAYALAEDTDSALVPVDTASVCVNIDTDWFEANDVTPPSTLADLVDPAYENLFVTPAATTSSPGMAFLLTTIAEYGEDWPDYWADLIDNGAKVTNGWSDAYFVDFTAGSEKGTRPIVLSYDSSPAFTLTEDGKRSTTKALLDTCFRQVEYAGALAGADNPEGAAAVLEWLLSAEVQQALPEQMYVFGVRDDVELPPDWAKFATQPTSTFEVDPAEITANRNEWLTQWQDVTSQ